MGTPDTILVGQVPAWIGTIDPEREVDDPERGPIDIAVVAGRVEISLGTLWATLAPDDVLALAQGVLIAEATARFMQLRQDIDHARAVLEQMEVAG